LEKENLYFLVWWR